MSEQPRSPVSTWFELPASDFARAIRFYETVMATSLHHETLGETQLAIFPHRDGEPSGAVIAGGPYRPGADGPVVYLNCGEALDAALGRVAAAGGRIVQPRTELPGNLGAYAHIVDTEGNRVGLATRG